MSDTLTLDEARKLAQLHADQLARTVWLVRRRRVRAIQIATRPSEIPPDVIALEAITPRLPWGRRGYGRRS